ncbi:MAG: hypothetical protein DRQ55_08645 [Planctomycetota bacterium]|nr:MAG: hypothetical protein DRQ55_08645 [Planctomycetota bacterium]
MSFVRMARELMDRGHAVEWVFSRTPYDIPYREVMSVMRRHGIQVDTSERFYLSVAEHDEDLGASTAAFRSYLSSRDDDCLVVDRNCVGAGFAAHAARVPWAVVGTDGREWTHQWFGLNRKLVPTPGTVPEVASLASSLCHEGFPAPGRRSFVATSPFLNISFLPRALYDDGTGESIPACSHFLGAGPVPDTLKSRDKLLITFGNTFAFPVRLRLLRLLRPLIISRSIPTLVLTGRGHTEPYRDILRDVPSATIAEWMPYDEAFREARVVIGHGGNAYIWHGLLAGSPMLAVPWYQGDQHYGSLQLQRLQVGNAVPVSMLPGLSRAWRQLCMRIPSRITKRMANASYRLNGTRLLDQLQELLADDAVLETCSNYSSLMRSGGGVEAGASLLERLAREKAHVSTCGTAACCC